MQGMSGSPVYIDGKLVGAGDVSPTMPLLLSLGEGLTVGLGTDGAMSSDNLNLFEAMRFAALVGKIRFPHEPARWLGAAITPGP
jgi:cytosine/adenosine deaminase-related metal-dependent hydrolase